eukprot:TRINITY_DN8282_c0_g1_i1.p1 TRINITY_DN8282_c0_g1~~TRINITY_DN8282_c0_g1_i1.p1  ORF type:complete len:214 (+),score=56.24 TRINITY_DN8282_c0_g1_i1:92-733(+)
MPTAESSPRSLLRLAAGPGSQPATPVRAADAAAAGFTFSRLLVLLGTLFGVAALATLALAHAEPQESASSRDLRRIFDGLMGFAALAFGSAAIAGCKTDGKRSYEPLRAKQTRHQQTSGEMPEARLLEEDTVSSMPSLAVPDPEAPPVAASDVPKKQEDDGCAKSGLPRISRSAFAVGQTDVPKKQEDDGYAKNGLPQISRSAFAVGQTEPEP